MFEVGALKKFTADFFGVLFPGSEELEFTNKLESLITLLFVRYDKKCFYGLITLNLVTLLELRIKNQSWTNQH